MSYKSTPKGAAYMTPQQSPEISPPLVRDLPRRRSGREAIGTYGICVLSLGTIAVFTALGFLSLLWQGASDAIHGKTPPSLWRQIVAIDWTTRVLTLSSLLIRVAIAAQTGLLTSMLASLILERLGSPTVQLPLFSMARALPAGPHTLSWAMIRDFNGASHVGHLFVLLLALLTATVSQFTSTILLWDFGPERIVMGSTSSSLALGLNYDGALGGTRTYNGNNYCLSRPLNYPRFAEYSEPPYHDDGIQDTGLTYQHIFHLAPRHSVLLSEISLGQQQY